MAGCGLEESSAAVLLESRKKTLRNIYADLFVTFMKIGGFTFGGGYAMLPMLQKEVVENRHWATEEELMDYYAIGQCTPGVIAVNTATFIGYRLKGIAGGIVATLGVISPSIVIISIISAFLKNFEDISYVQYAFNGIRACVCVFILTAVIKLASKSVIDAVTAVIAGITLVITLLTDISPALVVVAAAAAGFIAARFTKKGKELK